MRFGVHIALWMSSWDEDIVPHLQTAAELGFGGVEISLLGDMGPGRLITLRHLTKDLGLSVTCTTGLSMDHDITSDDAAVRRGGLESLHRAIEMTAAMGSSLLTGVIYAPWGKRVQPDREKRWARSVEGLKSVTSVASDHGVTLGIEAINRFETDLVNTSAQATSMAQEIDSPNVGVLLDSFHLNIEEKDIAAAIEYSGPKLVHFHCSENDRGAPGSGHIPWDDVFSGLQRINYNGWLTQELFVQSRQEVSPDLAVWRDIEVDPTRAARQGLEFLKGHAQ